MNLHYAIFLVIGTYFFYWMTSFCFVLYNLKLENNRFRVLYLSIILSIFIGYLQYVLNDPKGVIIIFILFNLLFYWFVMRIRSYHALLISITFILPGLLENFIYFGLMNVPMSVAMHQLIDRLGTALIIAIILHISTILFYKNRIWFSFINKQKEDSKPIDRKMAQVVFGSLIILLFISIFISLNWINLLIVSIILFTLFGILLRVSYEKEISS